MVACSEEEPPVIDPIIGTWEMDDVEISDSESGYTNIEGSYSALYGEDRYILEFFEDQEYERDLDGIFDEDGEWSKDGDDLELDPDDDKAQGLDYEFKILEIGEREMLLESELDINVLQDNFVLTLDTITSQEMFDSLAAIYSKFVRVTATYEFDREN
jgi:hypothetical protein